MEKAMLTFDKVNAHYGKIQALHDVSLHINQGEIVTLIGANGAGKTTLLGTLCGDPRASSGRIVFDGKDITDWQTAKIMREAVAIVPEGRRVFSRMTVEENLAMGGFFAHRDEYCRLKSTDFFFQLLRRHDLVYLRRLRHFRQRYLFSITLTFRLGNIAQFHNIFDISFECLRRNAHFFVVRFLPLAAAVGFINRLFHGVGDSVSIQDRLTFKISRSTTNGLNQ